MGNRRSAPPPPPPPPPVPIGYRQYGGGYTCNEYHVRTMAKNTEIRSDWGCGANCPGGRGVNTSCGCACRADSAGARANTDTADRLEREAVARAAADRERIAREARERAAREAAERERLAREARERAERERIAREQAERDRIAREAAAKAAREAAERERIAREAREKAARDEAARVARIKAKADAKTAWDAAQVIANNAQAVWAKQKAEYDTQIATLPSLKLVYDNAQMVVDDIKAKKASYDEAIAQQTAANALLKLATDSLSKSAVGTRERLDKAYAEDSILVKNAALFPNTTFGIEKEFNTMSANWIAYDAAKKELSAIEASKVSDITTATEKLIETNNAFTTSKNTYSAAVISALKTNNTDSTYVKDSSSDAELYGPVYGLTNEYRAMVNAWTNVTKSVQASNASGAIVNYNTYLPTKTAFASALLVAQNKRAEANFQARLAEGKDAAAKWTKNGANGCRNIQTTASTDQNMLDQDISCNDTEYISGYTKVSGFDAAPVDPNVTRDNIAQYLAVKYSCCVAPAGAKGPQGKKGPPGTEGLPGVAGPPGLVGIAGPTGKQGPQGDVGEEGNIGPIGEVGDDGNEGEKGETGKPGTSIKMPFTRQVAGPMGNVGEMGPRGMQGPKGPDGVITPAPKTGFSELDRTIALFDVQDKISKYIRG